MMLRLGRRSLARAAGASTRRPRAPVAALNAQTNRQFWGSDMLSWLRQDKSEKPDTSDSQPRKDAAKHEPPAAAKAAVPSPTFTKAAEAPTTVHRIASVTADSSSSPSSFPTEHSDSSESLRAGGSTLRGFSHTLSTSSSPSRLKELWQVMSSFEPFVLEGSKLVPLSESEEQSRRSGTLVMQMLPCEVFAQLRAKETSSDDGSRRPVFRKKAPWVLSDSVTSATPVPGVDAKDVMLLNEAVVMQWTIDVFSRMKDHKGVIEFFERYNHDRHQRIDALIPAVDAEDASVGQGEVEEGDAASTAADRKAQSARSFVWMRRSTKLPPDSYAEYILALEATKQFPQLIRVLRKEHKRRECCTSIPTLRALLYGCISEKEGDLARAAIEQFSEYAPAIMIPLPQYETAIRANTISQPRTEHDLENALWIVRTMRNDAGYLLNPSIWNTLFNSCIYLELPERALAVFKTYHENQIAPYQRQFLNVFRSACRFGDYETVLAMIEFWMRTSRSVASKNTQGNGPRLSASKAEREAINTILWEMLKGKPSVDQVKRVLRKMQDWSVQSGAILLRRAVTKLLEDDNNKKTPHQLILESIDFWKELPSVMVRQGFLIHLLLEHCFANHWEDEYDYLIDLATSEAVVDVPQTGLTRYMESNDLRGRFSENMALGDRLAAERSTQQLGQKFFELYAMSYQRLERFDDVVALERKFEMTKTFPNSEALATIVRDAEANR